MADARLAMLRERLGRGMSIGETRGRGVPASPVPAGPAPGSLHEILAPAGADAAAATGFALGLAFACTLPNAAGDQPPGAPLLWVRQEALDAEAGAPHGPGLAEFGLDPARLTRVRARDATGVLQAGLEGARCPALGAVIVELCGPARVLDLTATRRLALAARASGVRLFLVRVAAPVGVSGGATAAETRWEVRPAPSRPLPANAPGRPALALRLLRRRFGAGTGAGHGGPDWWSGMEEGERRELEWDRDSRSFEERAPRPAAFHAGAAALSGDVVSLPAGGAFGAAPARRA